VTSKELAILFCERGDGVCCGEREGPIAGFDRIPLVLSICIFRTTRKLTFCSFAGVICPNSLVLDRTAMYAASAAGASLAVPKYFRPWREMLVSIIYLRDDNHDLQLLLPEC
jgi:hypothetical protein